MSTPHFSPFGSIKASTKTLIVHSNLCIDLARFFEHVPVADALSLVRATRRAELSHPDARPPSRRDFDPEAIPTGTVLLLKYKGKSRGGYPTKRKHDFLNSVTTIMCVEGKIINFKLSGNGKFQITGCKKTAHAVSCFVECMRHIMCRPEIFRVAHGDSGPRAYVVPAMRNIDFNLGFNVDRAKLDKYINSNTDLDFRSMLETSFGYTGINVKVPVKKSLSELNVTRVVFHGNAAGSQHSVQKVPYSEFMQTLSHPERMEKERKRRYNTFLIFHSGKVIMSGLKKRTMEDTYNTFTDIIKECHEEVREKLRE